jgi:hypothetical protein
MTLDFCLKFIFKNRHAGVIPAGRQAMPHKTVNTIFILRHARTDLS